MVIIVIVVVVVTLKTRHLNFSLILLIFVADKNNFSPQLLQEYYKLRTSNIANITAATTRNNNTITANTINHLPTSSPSLPQPATTRWRRKNPFIFIVVCRLGEQWFGIGDRFLRHPVLLGYRRLTIETSSLPSSSSSSLLLVFLLQMRVATSFHGKPTLD